MSVCVSVLLGNKDDFNVEVWSPDYNSENVWLVYEDALTDDRIDLSHAQLRELSDVIDALLS